MQQVRRAEQTYEGIIAGHPVSFAAFRQGPWYLQGVLTLEESQLTMRSPYLDNDFIQTVFRSPAALLTSNDICLRLIGDHHRSLLDVPTDRGVGGNRSRMAEMLSHSALEFLFRAEYAYDMGMPPALARLDHALSFFHFGTLIPGEAQTLPLPYLVQAGAIGIRSGNATRRARAQQGTPRTEGCPRNDSRPSEGHSQCHDRDPQTAHPGIVGIACSWIRPEQAMRNYTGKFR